jgi:cadmium resistance protein CadD (predicted permease)
VERLGATVTTASILFAGTNLDDMVVLAVLNASSRADGRPHAWHIWVGQYAGITVLVGASLLAAFGLTLLPDSRTWLLGFVPLALGAYKLVGAVRARRLGTRPSVAVASGLPGIVAVTVANGGDNIAAYTPLFRTSSVTDIAITVAVFAIGVAIWCAAGSWLVSHRRITDVITRWGHWIVPAVFIAIGGYIFYKGGVFGS